MPDYSYLSSPAWRRNLRQAAFGRGFLGFLGAAFAAGVLCWFVKGWSGVEKALLGDIGLLMQLLPRLAVALAIAGLIWVMLPREKLAGLVGRESGMAGLMIALVAGAVTPGGPTSAYALLAVLAASGADRGALVSYITAWALLGLQRVLVWDVPFMGSEFAMLRLAVSLPLPILAGVIARALPLTLTLREPPEAGPVNSPRQARPGE